MDLTTIGKLDRLKLFPKIEFIYHYAGFLLRRARQDNIKVPAGYLAYVTLLSLVPFLAIVFDILSAFPMFNELQATLEHFIYANFIPSSGDLIQGHISGFIENTKKMTMMGIVSLVVIALLLISAIDQSINRIWRSTKKRNVVHAFALYWTILSLGPVLAGGSIALSSYILASAKESDILSMGDQILSVLPFIFTWLSFAGVYTLVPRKKVSIRYALIGGLIAALLFSCGTQLFSLYILHFPTQQLIYGALAILPILFIWVYFSWYIVLAGAIVTATLEEYIQLHYLNKNNSKSDKDGLNDSDDPEGY